MSVKDYQSVLEDPDLDELDFTQSNWILKEEMPQTQINPYKCAICETMFTQKPELIHHLYIMHIETFNERNTKFSMKL